MKFGSGSRRSRHQMRPARADRVYVRLCCNQVGRARLFLQSGLGSRHRDFSSEAFGGFPTYSFFVGSSPLWSSAERAFKENQQKSERTLPQQLVRVQAVFQQIVEKPRVPK